MSFYLLARSDRMRGQRIFRRGVSLSSSVLLCLCLLVCACGGAPDAGAGDVTDPGAGAQADVIEANVRKVIALQLGYGPEELKPAERLVHDLGADELDLMELVLSLEEEFGFEVSAEEEERLLCEQDVCAVTVDDVIRLVLTKLQSDRGGR